ncbi:hypothetical protein LXA43DRAFT_1030311 [Ganoderma leucocontextum]|nr:hypothetical protein LXA43DRAFT_1030311 [Ganoderma leucocontextum]
MSIINYSITLLLFALQLFSAANAATANHPKPRQYTNSTINVGNGTELAYLDSGSPGTKTYTTIFAIHGMGYYSPVFQKVLAEASSHNTRFVAITRRDYNGSTPYTSAELSTLQNGPDTARSSFFQARGQELATFIETFISQNNIPAPSSDGKTGGVGVLGWSLGNTFSVSLLANIGTYSNSTQQTLAKYVRATIFHEPPSVAFGLTLPPQSWSPQIDTSIPENYRQPGFVQWITAYFQHGDLSTRNVDVLEFIQPSIAHVPSVFTMTQAQLDGMTDVAAADTGDTFIVGYSQAALLPIYKKAFYDETVRAAFPLMKALEFAGDITANFGIVALWQIEDDNTAAGGGFVTSKILTGTNHFVHWDNPTLALTTYLSAFSL